MINLSVNINSKNIQYPIYISNEDICDLKSKIISEICDKNYVVVISEKVYKLYGKALDFPKKALFVLKDGEIEKNQKNYLKILDFMLKRKLKREDAIIAIGGGVVGDIAGFAASTYMRGINFVQVPTTLLAATDSSVGGKVAINTKYGKNLVGAFYQPKAVFVNINFLKTLDEKQYKSGLGEVIKYGFIEKSCNMQEDAHLINFLTENYEQILSRDVLKLRELIKMCISLKIAVVERDEKEGGLRKILNYGHTYGHAIENLTHYKKYTHGQCVVDGILFALKLALSRNLIDKEYKFLCEDLIKKFGYQPLLKFDKNKIISVMLSDKKATNEYIKFILPNDYATVGEYDFTPSELGELIYL